MIAKYFSRFDPVHPCLIMSTRHCPAVYETTCEALGEVCARFESDDETPWLFELPGAEGDGADAGRPTVGQLGEGGGDLVDDQEQVPPAGADA